MGGRNGSGRAASSTATTTSTVMVITPIPMGGPCVYPAAYPTDVLRPGTAAGAGIRAAGDADDTIGESNSGGGGSSSSSSNAVPETIYVQVVCAVGLPPSDSNGYSDPCE